MRLFNIILFSALFAVTNAFAGGITPATGQTYISACGSIVPSPVSQSNILYFACQIITAANHCTLRLHSATAGYQVPVGKTLHIFAECIIQTSTGTAAQVIPEYGTNDVGNDGTAPTGVQIMVGAANNQPFLMGAVSAAGSAANTPSMDFQIPATDYPAARVLLTQATVFGWGYLQ